MSRRYDAAAGCSFDAGGGGRTKVNKEERVIGALRRGWWDDRAVRVACVEGGRACGFGRCVVDGTVTVRMDAADERDKKERRRRIKGEPMIEKCIVAQRIALLVLVCCQLFEH